MQHFLITLWHFILWTWMFELVAFFGLLAACHARAWLARTAPRAEQTI